MKKNRFLWVFLLLSLLIGCGRGQTHPLISPEGAALSYDLGSGELLGLRLGEKRGEILSSRRLLKIPLLSESLVCPDLSGEGHDQRESMLRYEPAAGLRAGERSLAVTLFTQGDAEEVSGVFVYDLFSDPEEAERLTAAYEAELAPLTASPVYRDSLAVAGMKDCFPLYAAGSKGREEVRLFLVRDGSLVSAELPAHPAAEDLARSFSETNADYALLLSRCRCGEGAEYEGWFGMALLSREAMEPLMQLWRGGGNSLIR